MAEFQADLKVFIRKLVNQLPKNRDKTKPIIRLEFKESYSREFFSRIDIYRIESLNILWYRFTDNDPEKPLTGWSVTANDFRVINIIPPSMSIGKVTANSLPVIQVEKYRG